MASFTDQIPQFNPYIQQLPVEAMVKVGMEKQQRYDLGLQKIQGQIEQVAGLDVLRPVEKEYLTSKLDELGSNLKSFAASDFSNFQLVNSVGGMVNQLSKDPFVLAGVKSAALDRKNSEEIENDREKGLLTEHAQYFYQRQRDAFLNNPNLSDDSGKPVVFGGRYVRSFDIEKAMQEAIKSVGDSKWSAENVFVTDPLTGKIKRDIVRQKDPKTGQIIEIDKGPMLSPYAVKEIREGRFSENVQAAIEGVLSRPEAKQELLMQGVYNYRNFNDKESFIKQYQAVRNEGVALLEAKKLDLMSKNATEKDPEKKTLYENLLTNIEGQIQSLNTTEAEKIREVSEAGSLDMYKGALQSQVKKNSWLRQFVTEQRSVSYEKSAPWEAHRQQIKDERDWWATQDASKRGWASVAISRQNAELDAEKWKYDEKNPKSPFFKGVDMPELPFEKGQSEMGLYADFIQRGADVQRNFDDGRDKLVEDYILSLNHNNGKSVTREQVKKDIDKWKNSDPNFVNRFYTKAKEDITKNPKAFPSLASGLAVVTNLERDLENYANESKDLDNSSEVLSAGGNLDFSNLGKGIKPFTITYAEPDDALLFGRSRGLFEQPKQITLSFDAKDVVNATIVAKGGTFASAAEKAMAQQAEKSLTSKFGRPVKEVLGALGITGTQGTVNGGILLSKGVDKKTIESIQSTNQTILGKMGSAVIKAKEEALKKRQMGNSALAYSVYPSGIDSKEKESIDNKLKAYLSTFTEAGIDVSNFQSFYSGKDRDMYTVNVGVTRGTPSNPDVKLSLDLYSGKELIQSIPMTEKAYMSITGKRLSLPIPVSDVAKKVQWNVETQSTNSTVDSPEDPRAVNGAYYKPYDFAVSDSRIQGGDIFKGFGSGYNAYIYVKEGNKTRAVPVYASKDDAYPVTFPNADAAEKFLKGVSTPSQISYFIDNSKK